MALGSSPLGFESVGLSPYLRRLRAVVGHDLLLLPSVALLLWDDGERLLLVREAQTTLWQTVGGAIEPDESPADAAMREAAEKAGVIVRLSNIRAVLGGPQYRITYPNGDRVSYVSTVYDARVIDGEPRADAVETSDVGWFSPEELDGAELSTFTRVLLEAAGVLSPRRARAAPVSAQDIYGETWIDQS